MKTIDEKLEAIGLDKVQVLRAVEVMLSFLPHPVDLETKYEITNSSLPVAFTGDRERDKKSFEYLAKFGEDNGYNKYYIELMNRIVKGDETPVEITYSMV